MLLRSHIDRTNQNRVVKMDTAGGMDWQAYGGRYEKPAPKGWLAV